MWKQLQYYTEEIQVNFDLACDKFSSCIISCQCIITSLFQHKKLYTIILVNENDETMHWLEMVLGDIACLQLDTGTDSKVNSR